MRGEFDAAANAVIAAKLRTLRADEPALGGGWIAMANACSLKEAGGTHEVREAAMS